MTIPYSVRWYGTSTRSAVELAEPLGLDLECRTDWSNFVRFGQWIGTTVERLTKFAKTCFRKGILRFRTSFHSHHCSDQAVDCTLSSRSATNSKPPESRLRSRSCFLNMGCRLSASCSISMQCPRHMAFNKYSLCEYPVVLDLLSPHQHLDGCGASHLDRGHRKSASYKWVIGACIAQLIYTFPETRQSDLPYSLWPLTICTQIVQCTSITTACIPYLQPFLLSLESGLLKSDDFRNQSIKHSRKQRSLSKPALRSKPLSNFEDTEAALTQSPGMILLPLPVHTSGESSQGQTCISGDSRTASR